MLYFILWTVVILVVFLSIPVAHFVEVNRRKKELAAAQGEPEGGEEEVGEVEEFAEEGEEEVVEMADAGDEGFAEYEEQPVEGGDDFSAFDEAFDEEK